jgi:hypothetical protein
LLRDGEWVDFLSAAGSRFFTAILDSKHEKKHGHTLRNIARMRVLVGPLTKWVEEILLNKQLGNAFFRPKRLEFDAGPFLFDPLVGAKKVGSHWELEIKGADEPNRATVSLDSNFKLIALTKNPVAHWRTGMRILTS